jgi:hypothetical protein
VKKNLWQIQIYDMPWKKSIKQLYRVMILSLVEYIYKPSYAKEKSHEPLSTKQNIVIISTDF